MKHRIAALILFLMMGGALAQNNDTNFATPGGGNIPLGGVGGCLNALNQAVPCSSPTALGSAATGSYPGMVPGTTLTRAANTVAYTGSQTVCQSISVACTPGTIPLATFNTQRLIANRVTLWKSGSSTSAASFLIWFFSATPGLATPTQEDATAYTGPRTADMPNYLGNAACATGTATSDTSPGVWYECTLSNPNTAGALDFQAASGTKTVYYLISVAASSAYTPASSEQFIPYVGGFY
jgi:hypothetical protein